MNTTEQLKVAREALSLTANLTVLDDPRNIFRPAIQAARKAIITIDAAPQVAESAPSIDTPEFRALLAEIPLDNLLFGLPVQDLVIHINQRMAQEREAGRQEGYAKKVGAAECGALAVLEAERERAENAEARLKELHDIAWAAKPKLDAQLAARPAIEATRIIECYAESYDQMVRLGSEWARCVAQDLRGNIGPAIAALLAQDKPAAPDYKRLTEEMNAQVADIQKDMAEVRAMLDAPAVTDSATREAAEQAQRERIQARFDSRPKTPATADFDLPAPNDAVPASDGVPLPEPLEIDWPELNSQALGCGVEDRNIHDRYEAAEYGWQDGVDKAVERVPEEIFDADQLTEYGNARATAAWNSAMEEAANAVASTNTLGMTAGAGITKCCAAIRALKRG